MPPRSSGWQVARDCRLSALRNCGVSVEPVQSHSRTQPFHHCQHDSSHAKQVTPETCGNMGDMVRTGDNEMIVQSKQARASHRRGQQHESEALALCPQEHHREQWAYHDNANHEEQLKRTKTDLQLRVGSAV